jgi:general stress protein 26
MNRIEIDYQELEAETIHFISHHSTWILATSANSHVTARSVSTVNIGLKMYFQTDTSFTKYRQIMINPHVALCLDNFQIEGMARGLGHPLSANNKFFGDLFKNQHPLSYARYSVIPTSAVVEINITQISIWRHINNKTYRDYLLLVAKNAYREEYFKENI